MGFDSGGAWTLRWERRRVIRWHLLNRAVLIEGGHRALARPKEDIMSSPIVFRPPLSPSNLAMLVRVLAQANSTGAGPNSFKNRQLAAFLIYKFQAGMTQENELLDAVKPIAAEYPNMKAAAVW